MGQTMQSQTTLQSILAHGRKNAETMPWASGHTKNKKGVGVPLKALGARLTQSAPALSPAKAVAWGAFQEVAKR
ncbi:hypothetical protein OKHIF_06270 [Mycobacteroides chelonae]